MFITGKKSPEEEKVRRKRKDGEEGPEEADDSKEVIITLRCFSDSDAWFQ